MKLKIGYIGLGLMGRPIVLNLLRAGYEVGVYARREATLTPLVEAGATAYATPAELALHCDVIFTNVSDSNDVEEVVLGERGIIHGARRGAIVIDMSTISPIATRNIAARLSENGIDMLDAPVSGGTQGAIDATLSIMVGGKAEALQRVMPLLQTIGKNIVHIGAHGAGQIAKACNQLVVAQNVAAVGEAFILARAAGVDPARVREALLGGFAGSKVLDVHGQRMLDDNYTPGFKAKLHKKDMAIVCDTITKLGLDLPGTERVSGYIETMVEQGLGEVDSAALVKLLESRNRIQIKT